MKNKERLMPDIFSWRGCSISLIGLILIFAGSGCKEVDTPQEDSTEPIPTFTAANSYGSQAYADSRRRMWEKFNGPGFELVVDAMKGQLFYGVEFFSQAKGRAFYAASLQSLQTQSILVLSNEVPETAIVIWRQSANQPIPSGYGSTTYADPLIGEATIPFGKRIPDEVIQSLRKEGGGIRFKVRMSNDGPYFGWDIGMRKGYEAQGSDMHGHKTTYWENYRMAGGDFREAEIINGEVVRPGWYIDKKTGQRIETDY